MAKWLEILFKTNEKRENEKVELENKIFKITSLEEYREALKNGIKSFDFSEFDIVGEDIQNINLENLNLDIDLRRVFVPYDGSFLIGNNRCLPLFGACYGDYYLEIKNSRLGGNNVTGDLTLFNDHYNHKPVYVWYSEETFDDKYKAQYPQFFISKDAPQELREKYYNPKVVINKVADPVAVINDLEEKYKEIESLVRPTLTIDEYLKYYEFLKGKYLGNFSISKHDLLQIELIEKYGIEKRKEILKHINCIMDSVNVSANCDDYAINEIDDKGVSLTLKLKFKK